MSFSSESRFFTLTQQFGSGGSSTINSLAASASSSTTSNTTELFSLRVFILILCAVSGAFVLVTALLTLAICAVNRMRRGIFTLKFEPPSARKRPLNQSKGSLLDLFAQSTTPANASRAYGDPVSVDVSGSNGVREYGSSPEASKTRDSQFSAMSAEEALTRSASVDSRFTPPSFFPLQSFTQRSQKRVSRTPATTFNQF